MRFNEEQKRKLFKMIREKVINHPEKVVCYYDHQFLNDQYVFKFSDEHYIIDIILHKHSNFHKDLEIDINDRINHMSLIFDTHQYFINPKDVRKLIKSLIDFSSDRMVCPNMDVESAEIILNENEEQLNSKK